MSPALAPAAPTEAGLATAFEALARPGGWLTAAQRLAAAEATRAARGCALCAARREALSPNAVAGRHDTPHGPDGALSAAALDATHRIATDPGRLSRAWYDAAIADGLGAEEIVELTSVVSVVTIADTLARALDAPRRPLPDAQPGEPPRRPVPGTSLERGWVPMVEPDAAEGPTKAFYEMVEAGAGYVFNVARALSAVPEALRDFFSAFYPNYSTHGPVREGGLDRVQVELLAATTSAHNDCFY